MNTVLRISRVDRQIIVINDRNIIASKIENKTVYSVYLCAGIKTRDNVRYACACVCASNDTFSVVQMSWESGGTNQIQLYQRVKETRANERVVQHHTAHIQAQTGQQMDAKVRQRRDSNAGSSDRRTHTHAEIETDPTCHSSACKTIC